MTNDEINTALSLSEAADWIQENETDQDICAECGGPINRVNCAPLFGSYEERMEVEYPFPQGVWICEACNENGGVR